jgi:two-component system sensor histidine kinase ChiS
MAEGNKPAPLRRSGGAQTGAQGLDPQLDPTSNEDYLATVYHGLLQSIQSISGYFELLLGGKVPDPNQRDQFLAIAYREAQYLVNRIGDLILTASIQRGALDLDPQPCAPSQLVRSALRKFRPKTAYKGITIESTLPDLPPISIDEELMVKALLAIMDALIKFAPREARLRLKVQDHMEEIEFQIGEGSGGLTPEIMGELSTWAAGGGEAAVHATTGLGVGLSNAKHIVGAHGGRIWFKVTPRGGSSFTFMLPKEAAGRRREPTADSRPRVLIVDDEPTPLEMMEYALAHEGYRTTTAINGIEALEIAKQERVDLIVLDVMLPGIDGYEVCHRLRAEPQTADIPVLMISAKAKEQDKATALRVGAQAYFKKPFSMSDLTAGVAKLLADSRRDERSESDGIPIID